MYVVADTSVLIAAFLNRQGLANRILQSSLKRRELLICLSIAIIQETMEKLDELGNDALSIDEFLRDIRRICAVCDDADYTPDEVECDDHIVGCYRRCRANLVVTNDKALLRWLKREFIPAVRPSDFQSYLM